MSPNAPASERPSARWRITDEDRKPLTEVDAPTVADALDVLAMRCGYASHEARMQFTGAFTGHVVYVGRAS